MSAKNKLIARFVLECGFITFIFIVLYYGVTSAKAAEPQIFQCWIVIYLAWVWLDYILRDKQKDASIGLLEFQKPTRRDVLVCAGIFAGATVIFSLYWWLVKNDFDRKIDDYVNTHITNIPFVVCLVSLALAMSVRRFVKQWRARP